MPVHICCWWWIVWVFVCAGVELSGGKLPSGELSGGEMSGGELSYTRVYCISLSFCVKLSLSLLLWLAAGVAFVVLISGSDVFVCCAVCLKFPILASSYTKFNCSMASTFWDCLIYRSTLWHMHVCDLCLTPKVCYTCILLPNVLMYKAWIQCAH